ncbi:cytidine/deoxycytidylate deaminase family protein [candidate division NPL-UPA2 bacterium]|nr:cytidine/deoxycytidylate deaminase family protein [candidate division NPL-UPA2 bacterium]
MKKKRKAKTKRPSWDNYFLKVAELISERSTCLRRRVGVVIVKDKRIISSGYNGAPAGLVHCKEVGCLRMRMRVPRGERHELCRGLHGEQNAIIQAALYGASIREATLYATHQPCSVCAKMIINAGIQRIVIAKGYPDEMARTMLQEAGIPLVKNSETVRQLNCQTV